MNSCNFCGRLTKDPELKTKQDGGKYAYFCLAVDAGKNKNGEKQTDFIDFLAYNKTAEFLTTYCIKGSLIEVNGRLHTYTKDLSDGNKAKVFIMYADNIGILGGGKPKEQAAQAEQAETPSELPFDI